MDGASDSDLVYASEDDPTCMHATEALELEHDILTNLSTEQPVNLPSEDPESYEAQLGHLPDTLDGLKHSLLDVQSIWSVDASQALERFRIRDIHLNVSNIHHSFVTIHAYQLTILVRILVSLIQEIEMGFASFRFRIDWHDIFLAFLGWSIAAVSLLARIVSVETLVWVLFVLCPMLSFQTCVLIYMTLRLQRKPRFGIWCMQTCMLTLAWTQFIVLILASCMFIVKLPTFKHV